MFETYPKDSRNLSLLFDRFSLITGFSNITAFQCDPYFDTTGCSHPGCEPAYPTPACKTKCESSNLMWSDSKHYSVNAYQIRSDPHSIMAELYKNGPIEVDFTVYEVTITFQRRKAFGWKRVCFFIYLSSYTFARPHFAGFCSLQIRGLQTLDRRRHWRSRC